MLEKVYILQGVDFWGLACFVQTRAGWIGVELVQRKQKRITCLVESMKKYENMTSLQSCKDLTQVGFHLLPCEKNCAMFRELL